MRHRSPEFSVFLRKARQAAHQALFFLYELEPLEQMREKDRLLDADVVFARNQVRVLLDAVQRPADTPAEHPLPPATKMTEGPAAYLFERDGEPAALFAIHEAFISDDEARMRPAARQIAGFWATHVCAPLHPAEGATGWTAAGMVLQLRAFLQISRPVGFEYVSHLIDRTWLLGRRNMAFLVGLAGAVAAFAGVEQLRSLLLNNVRGYVALAIVGAGGIFNHALWWAPVWTLKVLASAAPGPLAGPLRKLLESNTARLRRATLKLRLGKRAFFRLAAHATTPERGVRPWPEAGRVRRLIGRWEICRGLFMLLYLAIAYSIGLHQVGEGARETFRTVYPVAALLLLGLNALHWVDLWEFIDPRPIRTLGLWLFGLFLFGSLVLNRHLLFATGIPLALFLIWFHQTFLRRRETGEGPRYRFTEAGVCAAISCLLLAGSAFWGSRTAEREVWRADPNAGARPTIAASQFPFPGNGPVVLMAASGGGSRAAIYTALTLDSIHNDTELRPIGAAIQAVSSVSGGSLAAAAYIAERMRRNGQTPPADHGAWNTAALVRLNFLNPTLVGALRPGVSRGDAIEAFWNEHVGLDGHTLRELADSWKGAAVRGDAGAPFPLPLFNSCALDGHAMVISPIAHALYAKDGRASRPARLQRLRTTYGLPESAGLTWVVDRDAIYGLDDWNESFNPTLAQAVRASANFPFGFPLVEVDTPYEYASPYERGDGRIRLTDGGVLNNSGVWSLYNLTMTRPEIRAALKKRGVLMLIVDASRMPEYKANRNELSTLFGAIGDQAPIAQNLHNRMFELLAREYGQQMEIVEVDLPPTIVDNVQTTWALDARSLDKLTCNFQALWSNEGKASHPACGDRLPVETRIRSRLLAAWRKLTNPRKEEGEGEVAAAEPRTFDLLRVPLD